jgi:hypothetical protein
MKKAQYVLLGSVILSMILISCLDTKDFDLDKFSTNNITPTLYVPILNDTLKLNENENIEYDENGQACFYFNLDNIDLPSMSEFFELGDANAITLSGATFTYPGDGVSISLPPVSYTAEYSYSGLAADQRIDTIVFKQGQLTLSNASNFGLSGNYTVTIPTLTRPDGTVFTETVDFSSATPLTVNLTGYKIKMTKARNAFELVFTLTGTTMSPPATPPAKLDFNLAFSNIAFSLIYGYFGKIEERMAQSVNIGTFDNYTGICNIEAAYLNVTATSGAGVPFRVVLSEISANGITQTNVDSLLVEAASQPGNAKVIKSKIGGTAVGNVLSTLPEHVDFVFTTKTNPDADPNTTMNFMTAESAIKASAEVVIPVKAAITDLTVTEVLDFDLSEIEFQKLSIKLNVKNNMPVNVWLKAYLMDDNGNYIYNPDGTICALFPDNVEIPVGSVNDDGDVVTPYLYTRDLTITDETIAGMQQAKKIEVQIVVNSPDAVTQRYVRITKDNYVHVKAALGAKVNFDDLDD